ncbi:MAG: hypothetical protein Q4E61_03290 [Alphaproteobacteria bacterium]|nr:hypothetical protein [Alphaproteobacteria bacterium]
MLAWLIIGIAIAIWFVTGLYFTCWRDKKTKCDLESNPIDNKEYKRFLRSNAYETIMNIAVKIDYEE